MGIVLLRRCVCPTPDCVPGQLRRSIADGLRGWLSPVPGCPSRRSMSQVWSDQTLVACGAVFVVLLYRWCEGDGTALFPSLLLVISLFSLCGPSSESWQEQHRPLVERVAFVHGNEVSSYLYSWTTHVSAVRVDAFAGCFVACEMALLKPNQPQERPCDGRNDPPLQSII